MTGRLGRRIEPMKNHSCLTLGTIFRFTLAAVAIAALLLTAFHSAHAQERGGNFLDNLFNRGEPQQQQQGGQMAQGQGDDPAELGIRIGRLENALRQLTGTIEQLQYRNQQLEQQVRALQGGGANPVVAPGQTPVVRPGVPGALQPSNPPQQQPGRRGDVFDPSQNPDAPGAPRTLGSATASNAPANDTPVGAPNGRAAGAPLDLSTLSGNAAQAPSNPDSVMAQPAQATAPRDVTAGGTRLATLPPSASPQDEYDLAYGYVLRKDYALADQTFRDFLKKHPNEALVPDAQYWLGESLYQRQRYRDAAEAFLAVSTKHEKAGKAPNALLRLGQSLAALNQKEAACATLAEVERKYPKAPASVKRGVEQEIKRARC